MQKCKQKPMMLPRPNYFIKDDASDMEEHSTSEEERISIGSSNSTVMNANSKVNTILPYVMAY